MSTRATLSAQQATTDGSYALHSSYSDMTSLHVVGLYHGAIMLTAGVMHSSATEK